MHFHKKIKKKSVCTPIKKILKSKLHTPKKKKKSIGTKEEETQIVIYLICECYIEILDCPSFLNSSFKF